LPSPAALGSPVYSAAIDAPFASPGIEPSAPGGAAPFTVTFATTFSTGPGDALATGTYRSGSASQAATISGGGGAYWANATMTFAAPGTYEVYLYAVDTVSQLLLLTTFVAVAPGPGPVVALNATPVPAYVDEAIRLTANATGGSGNYSVAWSFGNGGTANGTVANATYTSPGTYLVRAAVSDREYGGTTPAALSLVVYGPPHLAIGVVPTAVDGGYVLGAFATGTFLGPLTYTWLFGDGGSGTGANVSHTYTSAGTYLVELRAVDPLGHATVTEVNLTVAFPTAPSGSGSSAFPPAAIGIAVIAAALAIALAVVLVRGRRSGGAPPGARDDEGPPDAPKPDLSEERPYGAPESDGDTVIYGRS
jgi:PKD repeat protein